MQHFTLARAVSLQTPNVISLIFPLDGTKDVRGIVHIRPFYARSWPDIVCCAHSGGHPLLTPETCIGPPVGRKTDKAAMQQIDLTPFIRNGSCGAYTCHSRRR